MNQHISFNKSPQIFGAGFLSGPKMATTNTVRMMVAGLIDFEDGSIRESSLFLPHMDTLYIQYLWSYIYYLYYINRADLSVFRYMTDERTKRASAANFYHVVRSYINDFKEVIIFREVTPLDKLQLATFIQKVIRKYNGRIKIPVVTTFREMINRENPQMSKTEITVRTGEDTPPEIVTDNPQNILNSDIKLIIREARR